MTVSTSWPHNLSIGIITADSIEVSFNHSWQQEGANTICDQTITITKPAAFFPLSPHSTFTLHNVTIGKQYHWQRHEDQTFKGGLHIIAENGALTAVNIINIEDYLESVISSEMSAEASLEFLKAAAVISRSWVVRQIMGTSLQQDPPKQQTPTMYVTWFDHSDHTLYNVCADDHCQRYQGISRISNSNALRAVRETCGQILTYHGTVCDCRFSKCCGGRTEEFSTCWQQRDVPYLRSIEDRDPKDNTIFCNTNSPSILGQVLNDYDLETQDFFQWSIHYTQAQLAEILHTKLNLDFGNIIQITPLQRGPSGRISLIYIRGTLSQLTLGKELMIRSALSTSHLYSSAIKIEHLDINSDGVPQRFIINGKGWGHGVGLCQIGAAVMGSKGYSYRQILAHYYPDAQITTYTQPQKDKAY